LARQGATPVKAKQEEEKGVGGDDHYVCLIVPSPTIRSLFGEDTIREIISEEKQQYKRGLHVDLFGSLCSIVVAIMLAPNHSIYVYTAI